MNLFRKIELLNPQTVSPIESEKSSDKSSVAARDEHKTERIGKLSLMAGINLMDGVVIGVIKEGHGPEEFIEFLREVDLHYDPQTSIRIILDNQPSHRSKIVFDYLSTRPGRFRFPSIPSVRLGCT